MTNLTQAARFATALYGQRAFTHYLAYVRHEPMAQLATRKGREDPYAIYRQMRQYGPLYRTARGNWSTVSHRVCNTVLRDRRLGVEQDEYLDLSMLGMNPPDHTRLRRLAQPAFSPKTLPTFRARIERTVADLLDRAESPGGSFDLVSAFAAPLPISVITELLGIPDADNREFAEHGATVGSALDGIQSLGQAARFQASQAALHTLFENLFALRRREPADDLISHLIAAEGDQIQPSELEPMVFLLLIAGFETTVNLIGNSTLALLNNPDQWEALRADPENLAPKAVEEALRYDPPVQGTSRLALQDLELEGQHIHQGQRIFTMLAAAGRDPEIYPHPDTFDIARESPADHLAFSSGIHYCIGQPLARMEATIALQTLAERMPKLRITGPVRRRNTTTIRGLRQLVVSAD
ncbi:cytochrome P450 [Catenulispora acidiphila DSM 44928]|uniref:Cytochrome P450 n=1 Tax=Catenulispora acidiphila (strain DSM 44928 / JCM 14897 / NBRC 102108 / NRRL B-24433 / ID139908) TaxID=479433 RepID=C7PYJ5_CATAD|nr:cytochrome P450 [Catenulispora acidiphila]ACU77317.1 cytochrome P450 [Catenulispora acidiphila DSM 44928]